MWYNEIYHYRRYANNSKLTDAAEQQINSQSRPLCTWLSLRLTSLAAAGVVCVPCMLQS